MEILDFHSIFVERRRLHRDHLPPRAGAQLSLLHGKAGTLQVTFLHLYDCHVYKKHYLVFIVHSIVVHELIHFLDMTLRTSLEAFTTVWSYKALSGTQSGFVRTY